MSISQPDGESWFVFDVESIGLHGEGFAVAGVWSDKNGRVLREFAWTCSPATADGDAVGREWVREHIEAVCPIAPTHPTPAAVRTAFWEEWRRARGAGALMAVDCGWPVEARFLLQCVADDPAGRLADAPFPLHEIATWQVAAGLPALSGDETAPTEGLPVHHPLGDARRSLARLLNAQRRLAALAI